MATVDEHLANAAELAKAVAITEVALGHANQQLTEAANKVSFLNEQKADLTTQLEAEKQAARDAL